MWAWMARARVWVAEGWLSWARKRLAMVRASMVVLFEVTLPHSKSPTLWVDSFERRMGVEVRKVK